MAEHAATSRTPGEQAPQANWYVPPHMRPHRKMTRADSLLEFLDYFITPLVCLADTLRDAGDDSASILVRALADQQRFRFAELEGVIRRDVGSLFIEGTDIDVTSAQFATLAAPQSRMLHLLHEEGDEQYSELAAVSLGS